MIYWLLIIIIFVMAIAIYNQSEKITYLKDCRDSRDSVICSLKKEYDSELDDLRKCLEIVRGELPRPMYKNGVAAAASSDYLIRGRTYMLPSGYWFSDILGYYQKIVDDKEFDRKVAESVKINKTK